MADDIIPVCVNNVPISIGAFSVKRQSFPQIRTENHDNPLLALSNQKQQGLLGINIYNTNETDPRKFEYLIAVSSDKDTRNDITEYTIPAMTWAIFPCTLETIGKTEAMAITKWLPKSKYRPLNKGYLTGRMKSGAPDIEYYGKDGLVEIWIAVKETA